jgi:hypothetical protein
MDQNKKGLLMSPLFFHGLDRLGLIYRIADVIGGR